MTEYFCDNMSDLLARGAADAPAIAAPGRPALSFAGLRALAERTVASLNAAGIGRGDRVAMVLPNGPEMAALFAAAACGATTAPLNPAYKADEFDFYLSDLNAKLLVVQRGMETPARAVAAARKIPIAELEPGALAGEFTLHTEVSGTAALPGRAQAQDIALVLHTSGTTSRPKIVPLRQINVTASAIHIGEALALTPDDVCLNIMPLFHIHGLIAAVLASLAAGGSVSCTPGFNAFKFFSQFDEVRPSWFTAVPTMHQALLGLAARNAEIIARGRLRLIRSSSASLPPQVMTEVESVFGVPVIESYGMTEAAHQMAANPLPPKSRAFPAASASLPGRRLPSWPATARCCHRASSAKSSSAAATSPPATRTIPTPTPPLHRWLVPHRRPGLSRPDGYLRLTGRLKEIIIRGGEKISPLEVDNVLMDHPDIAQVLTFAMPHAKLGEEVAAAVVLREGAVENEHAIRDFAGERLAAFKVPRKIVFLQEIPKGATGKLMRIGLAAKLGLTA